MTGKKIVVIILIFIIAYIILVNIGSVEECITLQNDMSEMSIMSVNEIEIKDEYLYNNQENNQEDQKLKEFQTQNNIHINIERPEYNIPLDNKLLDYIWELSLENELSYELILSIIKVESNFDIEAVGKSRTSKDLGIMQLNNNYAYDFAIDAEVENFNPMNPYDNIEVAIFVLTRHRDYWRDNGYHEQDVFDLTLSSYNQGISGTESRGLAEDYVNKVYEYKTYLEKGE